MNKILIAGCAVVTAFAAVAMPTKKELAQAQKLVEDVTRADLKAIEAGAKSAKDVADLHKTLADKSEQEAEKYLLLQGAFKLYARSEEFDLAAEMLLAINREVEGVPPELILELINDEFHRGMGKKAPKVLAIFKQAKRTVKFQKELATTEKALKAKPKDPALNRKYGECQAELGNWKGAAIAFAKAGGDLAKMVAAEKDNSLPPQQIADFWWEYGGETGITPYKVHAAELYQKAMSDAKFEGLARTRAEQRIKDADVALENAPLRESTYSYHIAAATRKEPYVFELGNGVRKLELIRCPAGTFTMGFRTREDGKTDISTLHKVKISRPFWLAKCPLTIAQMKALVPEYKGKNRRPDLKGAQSTNPDAPLLYRYWNSEEHDALFAALNSRYGKELPDGYVFRYATAAEWEYALRDGGNGTYVQKDGKLSASWRGKRNGAVCELMPNAWGFHDMLGLSGDFLLDSGAFANLTFPQVQTDPVYEIKEGKHATVLGWHSDATMRWHDYNPFWGSIRLCIGPDLVSEWKSKQKNDGAKAGDVPTKDVGADLAKEKREMEEKIAAQREDKLYCVIDLSGGPNAKSYPVSYLDHAPATGWSDEYKTTKLVLRKIKSGSFEYLPGKKFTLTKPYYMGVFEVTQKQWRLVCDKPSTYFRGAEKNPAEYISCKDVRGVDEGSGDPRIMPVDRESFIGRIREKTGLCVDLPTEVQWEFACRAGTRSAFNNGGSNEEDLLRVGKCGRNGGQQDHHVEVGSFLPNSWGLYDMHGNVFEFCLDRTRDKKLDGRGWEDEVPGDPVDWCGNDAEQCHICRGGSWFHKPWRCSSSARSARTSESKNPDVGFRLAIQPK